MLAPVIARPALLLGCHTGFASFARLGGALAVTLEGTFLKVNHHGVATEAALACPLQTASRFPAPYLFFIYRAHGLRGSETRGGHGHTGTPALGNVNGGRRINPEAGGWRMRSRNGRH